MPDAFTAAGNKIKAEEEAAAAAKADDEAIARWQAAVKKLHEVAPVRSYDEYPAPDEPLLDPVTDVRHTLSNGLTRVRSRNVVYQVPVGSGLDVRPTIRAKGEPPSEPDGLAILERPFSALARDLDRIPRSSPVYREVEAAYGPARIAYMNKKKLSPTE